MKICFYALRDDELQFCPKMKEKYGVDFTYTAEYPNDSNISLAEGCDGVSCTPCDMSRKALESFRNVGVKYILTRSIGYDHIDLAAARELGMKVDTVSYTPTGVADYAIMLMLASVRRFAHILRRADLQDYSLKNKLGRDFSVCTVGVMGTGRIGTTVLQHLSGFGCRLLAYDVHENETARKYAQYVDRDTIFRESDIITLHMNANDDNYHIIGHDAIAKMKQGAYIINTARGKLVDSEALIAGIESGKLGGAALDVLEHENGLYYYNRMGEVMVNQKLAILRSFPNVILSPHTAFYTSEDVCDMVEGNFRSCYDFGTGKKLHGVEIQ
ncbi:MAG: D-lactate dehydrogenase VanH-A [Synergistaceae bacterium]|nr:D-lactate dehydrogenase VanH-A [Synergistaceae bacterium]MBQ7170602.1 D-lactate dehydrogenase VanH-A [Synergistaceae bacterium]